MKLFFCQMFFFVFVFLSTFFFLSTNCKYSDGKADWYCTLIQVASILFRRHYMTTVEVTCKDKSYSWLLDWITKKGARRTQHLSVETSFVESDSGKVSTNYDFQPSVGMHFMNFKGTWIRVERTREQRMMEPWETVQLTTIGRHRELFRDILEESRLLGE